MCYEAADVHTKSRLVSKILPALIRNVSMSMLAVSEGGQYWTLSHREGKLLIRNGWKAKSAFIFVKTFSNKDLR